MGKGIRGVVGAGMHKKRLCRQACQVAKTNDVHARRKDGARLHASGMKRGCGALRVGWWVLSENVKLGLGHLDLGPTKKTLKIKIK